METITKLELDEIKKDILKISNELDYLCPFEDKTEVEIRHKKLERYIKRLSPKHTYKSGLKIVRLNFREEIE